MPDRIQFHNIHHESTLSDLYVDEVGYEDDDSCVSDEDLKEIDLKNLVTDMAIDNDEVNDLVDDLNNKDAIHLNDRFGDIEYFVNDRI